MKRNLGILLLSVFLMTILSGCEKKELLKQKVVYGEATINNKALFQYTTIGEVLSNKYWFLPLGVDNVFIVKEGVCYLQMFLRDYEETDDEDFWLILVGFHVDENFPVIGKEYKIVAENRVDLGNIYNSFYWSGELRNFYSANPEFEDYGIAGLSTSPSHDKFIALNGSIKFMKGDSKVGEYSISYTLESDNNTAGETYHIIGKLNGNIKIITEK